MNIINSKLNISYPLSTTFIDYPDNESIAVLIYFMGCDKNCKGCHNPGFRNPYFSTGTKSINTETIVNEIESFCARNKTNKIVLSGGDPFYPTNIDGVKEIIKSLTDRYKIIAYTSYEKEYIISNNITGFTYIKSGVYNHDLYQTPEKTDSFIRFSSKNQNLYDSNLQLISSNGIYYFKEKKV
jgi:organic radical activating enzyme